MDTHGGGIRLRGRGGAAKGLRPRAGGRSLLCAGHDARVTRGGQRGRGGRADRRVHQHVPRRERGEGGRRHRLLLNHALRRRGATGQTHVRCAVGTRDRRRAHRWDGRLAQGGGRRSGPGRRPLYSRDSGCHLQVAARGVGVQAHRRRAARGEARHGRAARGERLARGARAIPASPPHRSERTSARGKHLMGRARSPELPPDLQRTLRRARRLEWLTFAYMASAVVLLALVLGSSQAMKTAWIEDLLGLIPPLAFLLALHFNTRGPTERFPCGFHRIVSIGHLCSALALFVMGAYLLVESALKLITMEYPTINSVEIFGHTIWLGWLMLPALAYSALPSVFLGRMKIPLAEELHNKVLYADAKMNKANWLTAGAAMVGVVGIGFGLWWADAAAAAIISLDITKDGVSNLRRAVVDLMDQTPTTIDEDDTDPLRGKLAAMLQDLDWVEEVDLRLREEGQVYFGEVLVVPSDDTNLTEKVEDALKRARNLDWRIHDLALTPVRELPEKDQSTR